MSWLIDRFPKLPLYWQLTRLNRPIGVYLLLWPTMWALWIAGEGQPSVANVIIFILGVILMRSAGCVINDYADRHLDGHVKRTKERPLAQKLISEKEALALFAILCLCAFILVLFTNTFTVYLSIGGVALASLYPFMKRYTHLPQVVLGAAFSWAIPMAFAAQTESLPDIVWLLYCANVMWTIVYDTQYAMVDRDDDVKIGIKSTAVLFGDADKAIIGVLQGLTIVTWILIANQMQATWPVYVAIGVAIGLFGYHQYLIRNRERGDCFKAFLHNHWVGAVLFAGLVGHYLIS